MTAMSSTRRRFIMGATGAAALIGAGLWRTRLLASPRDEPLRPLHVPPLMDARAQGNALALQVQRGETEFFRGARSATMGYNGSYLGPTLRVHRGDDVQVAITNALGEDTTVHWHGLLVPGHLDGGPHQNIAPGASWRPVLPVRQPAATLFYHSHVHGRTAEQVYAGLAGVLIVADDQEARLNLPSEYGVDDLPLVIQDRWFENGRMLLPNGMMTLMHGRRGNTLLVNGTPDAQARVPARLVRLRFVNGSNARTYALAFDDGRPMHWIASEAGLLAAPVAMGSLSLAPGERAEVLVDFSDARRATLVTAPDPNAPMMMGGPMSRLRPDGVGRQPVLAFEPIGPSGNSVALPTRLVAHAAPDPARATRRRRFNLDMPMGAMMGMGGGMRGAGPGGGAGAFGINGRAFDMRRVDERVRLGDTEVWEVSGDMMAHPFHVHGTHFHVLSRGGEAPMLRDQGLRDTVIVGEPVELLMQFTQEAAKAPFMYHCHILEHEDNGMMGQFGTT
jgi:blue copper oxidase